MVEGRGCLETVCICFGRKILFMDRVVMVWVREGGTELEFGGSKTSWVVGEGIEESGEGGRSVATLKSRGEF